MNSETSPDERGALPSWWQLGAGGLATASALVWLVAVVTMSSAWGTNGLLPTDGQLDAAADASYWAFLWEVISGIAGNLAGLIPEVAPAVVMPVVVPAVGAWLTRRREVVRARLGLATVAAWGVVFALAGMLTTVVVGPVPRHLPWLMAGTLGVAALIAALLALRSQPEPFRLELARSRLVAAAAIVLWGLGQVAAAMVHRILSPGLGASAATDGEWLAHLVGFQLPGLLALVAIVVVVCRRDTLLAVPAATVVAIQAVMSLSERLAPPTPHRETALPEIVGIPVDAAVHATAAAIVVAAVAGLILAARTEWHARTGGSVHAGSFPR